MNERFIKYLFILIITMKNLYQVAKDYITKPLMGIALVTGISGCCDESNNQNYIPREPVSQVRSLNQFQENEIGKMSELGKQYANNIAMRLGDMDGDGDLDIVVINTYGKIFVYENNMPQKGKY